MASAWPRSLTASPVTGNLSWANDPAGVKSQVKTSSPNGTHPIGLAPGSQAPSVSAGQGPVLWAWLDLNQRPHPNQRSTAERRANQPFRWSGDSVVLQDGVNRSPGCTSAILAGPQTCGPAGCQLQRALASASRCPYSSPLLPRRCRGHRATLRRAPAGRLSRSHPPRRAGSGAGRSRRRLGWRWSDRGLPG
jgi:hypothetical protein